MTHPKDTTSEVVARLKPSAVVDHVPGLAVSASRSAGDNVLAERLNEWIVRNNALKSDAAALISTLVAERDEAHNLAREYQRQRNGNFDRATTAETQLAALTKRVGELEGALTPSADTKADYIGEFQFTVTMMELDESDEPYECQRMVTVPWTTIKEIMAAISDRAARRLTGGEG